MPDPLEFLAELLAAGAVVVLSGAGLSTESGIPDYRGPTGRARSATPITFQEFVGSAAARQRYWARSHVGWHHIARAKPNAGHLSIASLESHGLVDRVITQNVDGLHQAAGSRQVIDLHGRVDRVVCLGCGRTIARAELDARLRGANAQWESRAIEMRPDGDAVIAPGEIVSFRVVDCDHCGGLVKPDVVFFGENVPKPRVARCFEAVDAARALLVLGSSLSVMSGYRFVRHAARLGVPIAIVNQGTTRGDADADVRIDAPLGAVLQTLTNAVSELRAATLVPG